MSKSDTSSEASATNSEAYNTSSEASSTTSFVAYQPPNGWSDKESDEELKGLPYHMYRIFKRLKMRRAGLFNIWNITVSPSSSKPTRGRETESEVKDMVEEAWERLKKSYVFYNGETVGTLSAMDYASEVLKTCINQVHSHSLNDFRFLSLF
jgi:hypothetical protein